MENHIFYYQSSGACLTCAMGQSTQLLQVMIWVEIAVDINGNLKNNPHTQKGKNKRKKKRKPSHANRMFVFWLLLEALPFLRLSAVTSSRVLININFCVLAGL